MEYGRPLLGRMANMNAGIFLFWGHFTIVNSPKALSSRLELAEISCVRNLHR